MKIVKKMKCTLKNYPTEVKVSEKRRAQYWIKGDTLPKKYSDTSKYGFDAHGILIELATNEKVIKNSKTAGKPRMLTINAQKIYVGVHHSVRSKIVNELHDIFYKEFKKQLPEEIILERNQRVLISLHFHDIYTSKLPDLDNLSNLFIKCGIDCLTKANNPNQLDPDGGTTHKLGIIPDDKICFIPHITTEFTPVEKVEDRKLDFNIYIVEGDFNVESILDSYMTSCASKQEKVQFYSDL